MAFNERPLHSREVFPTLVSTMVSHSWRTLAVRGALGVVVGALALMWPAATLSAFLLMAGAYLLADGVLSLLSGLQRAATGERFWPFLFEGLLSMGTGVLAFVRPDVFALAVVILVAIRCIVTGGAEIAAGSAVRRETGIKDWALWVAGGASMLFGVLLLLSPSMGITTLLWLGGFYAMVFGFALMGSAFRLRSWASHSPMGAHI